MDLKSDIRTITGLGREGGRDGGDAFGEALHEELAGVVCGDGLVDLPRQTGILAFISQVQGVQEARLGVDADLPVDDELQPGQPDAVR